MNPTQEPAVNKKRNTFYAIAFGRKTGVFFNNWDDAKFLTEYYTGAIFKGFEQINDAWEFVLSKNNQATLPKSMNEYYSLSKEEIILYRNLWEIDKTNKNNAVKANNVTTIQNDSRTKYINDDMGSTTANFVGELLKVSTTIEVRNDQINLTSSNSNSILANVDLDSNKTRDDEMIMNYSNGNLNASLNSQFDNNYSIVNKPITNENCHYCQKFSKKMEEFF